MYVSKDLMWRKIWKILQNFLNKALFSSQKILQIFSDSPSHRIFRRMHEVLNMDKNKNQLYSLVGIDEANLLSLVSPW